MPDDKSEVLKAVRRNVSLRRRIEALESTKMRPADEREIEAIDRDIKDLGYEIPEWAKLRDRLADNAVCGAITDSKILVNMLAVGRALSRNESDFPVFNTKTKTLCRSFLRKQKKPSFLQLCYRLYRALNPRRGGKIIKNLDSLLDLDVNPSRAGKALSKIDVAYLEEIFKASFQASQQAVAVNSGGPQTELGLKQSASTSMTVTLNQFFCREQNDNLSDMIEWVAFKTTVKNLEEVYNQIDDAIKDGSTKDLRLTIDWHRETIRTAPTTGVVERTAGYPLDVSLGAIDIHNGFSPWSIRVNCVEIDDDEYDEINEVIDQIDAAAELLSGVGQTVAIAGGPTVIGAAGAVAAAAGSFVSAACDLTEAVIDIINYFDEDDLIGTAELYSEEDYTGFDETKSNNDTLTASGNTEGLYDLEVGYYETWWIEKEKGHTLRITTKSFEGVTYAPRPIYLTTAGRAID
jgi:hypothetical protein